MYQSRACFQEGNDHHEQDDGSDQDDDQDIDDGHEGIGDDTGEKRLDLQPYPIDEAGDEKGYDEIENEGYHDGAPCGLKGRNGAPLGD